MGHIKTSMILTNRLKKLHSASKESFLWKTCDSKLQKIFTRFCVISFILSATIFVSAILISDTWFTELAISLTTLHCFSTLVLVIIVAFLKKRSLVFYGLILLFGQGVFMTQTYIKATPFMTQQTGEQLTILQYNTHRHSDGGKKIVDWIEQNHEKLDIVFLQEINPELKSELKRLQALYPYFICPEGSWCERAFFSKSPIKAGSLRPYQTTYSHYIDVMIETAKGKTLQFIGIHAMCPASPDHLIMRNAQFEELGHLLNKSTEKYKLITGDFNVTPYSPAYKRLIKQGNMKYPRTHSGSWPSHFKVNALRIHIDHLLVSDSIDYVSQHVGDNIASDHLPVITTIQLN